jgi:hypothetical protein
MLRFVKHISEATIAAPAIHLDVLISCLDQHYLNTWILHLLKHDEEFQALTFRYHQIYYMYDFATSKLNTPISLSAIKRIFQYHRTYITQALAHSLKPLQARGCHLAINDEMEQKLLAWIKYHVAKNITVTSQNNRARISNHYHLSVIRDWLYSFIAHHLN